MAKFNGKVLMRIFVSLVLSLVLLSCGSARKAQVRKQKVDTVIKTAQSYTGTPYKWGGTTRTGMDCSGLLCNSFAAVGYELPRTSEVQATIGEKVKLKNIEPGDLVFFATGKKKRRITHVGLVTSVRGDKVRFIHSSSSLGVVESDLLSEYYLKRFRTARRPF